MIKIFYPEASILQKWVKYLYIQKNTTELQKFLVFPNIGSAITIYENAHFEKIKDQQFIAQKTDSTETVLHLMRIDPVQITDVGKLEKISIVFHPLGINQFINVNLIDLLGAHDKSCIPITFRNFAELKHALKCDDDESKKIKAVEKLLVENFVGMREPIVQAAVAELSRDEEKFSIAAICKKINVSLRTLNRLFNRHLCISPSQFRSIHQFRHSLAIKLSNEKSQLGDVAFQSNYYDASYLIKMYKKFTGLNPRPFFREINADAENNYIYKKISSKQ
jgi:AraC-like DNA-binding protein